MARSHLCRPRPASCPVYHDLLDKWRAERDTRFMGITTTPLLASDVDIVHRCAGAHRRTDDRRRRGVARTGRALRRSFSRLRRRAATVAVVAQRVRSVGDDPTPAIMSNETCSASRCSRCVAMTANACGVSQLVPPSRCVARRGNRNRSRAGLRLPRLDVSPRRVTR